MTRKEALQIAIRQVQEEAVKSKLQELMEELPLKEWSAAAIFDALDQFAADHQRPPTVTDLRGRGLPSHTVIRQKFGMTAKEFLEQYYPVTSKRDYLAEFTGAFQEVQPSCAREYNRARRKGAPSWQTAAKSVGLGKWSELLQYAGLHTMQLKTKKLPQQLHVTSYYDLQIRLEEINRSISQKSVDRSG